MGDPFIGRAQHLGFRNGRCTRCGLGSRFNEGRCPPGYWMTDAEMREWDALGDRARDKLERRLGALRTTSALPDPKGTDRG